MTELLLYFTGALVSLFSIVNPLLAAPAFVSLTSGNTSAERHQLARRAALNVFGILLVFFISGSLILTFFGISINALRIGGGLMILTSAFGMINKKERLEPKEKREAQEKEDIAFSPLAMPLMSGPGAIAVIIGLASDIPDSASAVLYYLSILLVIAIVSLACFLTLVVSEGVVNKLGETLVKAFTRIMGFILLCVGVQYMVNGVEGIVLKIMQGY